MKNLALAKLQALTLAKTLPHAWLLLGDQDVTLKFAEEFSQWLLCLNKQDNLACTTCKSCHLFATHIHPDFCRITPPADKHTIPIDAVRMVGDFTTAKPQLSTQKVVLLYPGEDMPRQSANALLKNLEEPCSDTIYIVLAKHRELLLKTIVSRCQMLNFPVNNSENDKMTAITKQMSADLVRLWIQKSLTHSQLVEAWIKQWPKEVLYWFDIVLSDIIRFKYTQESNLAKSWSAEQSILSTALSPSKFWDILERLRQAQYWLGQNQNPNLQLLLEDMLLV